jgi:hypothetical protein
MAAIRIEAGLQSVLDTEGQTLDSAAAVLSHLQSPPSNIHDNVEPPRKKIKGNDGSTLAVPALLDEDAVILASVEIALVSSCFVLLSACIYWI